MCCIVEIMSVSGANVYVNYTRVKGYLYDVVVKTLKTEE